MRQFLLGLSISIAFILGCVTAQHVPGVAMPPASASTSTATYTGQRWEYVCDKLNTSEFSVDNMTETLNRFGAGGWELTPTPGGVGMLCFQRSQ
jgi:hypothetical protein